MNKSTITPKMEIAIIDNKIARMESIKLNAQKEIENLKFERKIQELNCDIREYNLRYSESIDV